MYDIIFRNSKTFLKEQYFIPVSILNVKNAQFNSFKTDLLLS